MQIVGICKPKPLALDPLDVLSEEGKGIGHALRQLSKIQVKDRGIKGQYVSHPLEAVYILVLLVGLLLLWLPSKGYCVSLCC